MSDTYTVQCEPSQLPLTSRFVKAILGNFCSPAPKGDDRWPTCSIGIAPDFQSIAATDSSSAIIVGKAGSSYLATQIREVYVEIERSKQYARGVELTNDDLLQVDADGARVDMPNIGGVISRTLPSMVPIGVVSPDALIAIGQAAASAGANSVELFQPRNDNKVLGFKFRFWPDKVTQNLFQNWEGLIEAVGVFTTQEGRNREEEDEETALETAEPGDAALTAILDDAKAKAKKGKKEVPAPTAAVEPTPPPAPVYADSPPRSEGNWNLPPLELLSVVDSPEGQPTDHSKSIVRVLRDFGLAGSIVAVETGPTVTLYQLEVPPGVQAKKYLAMADDLALQLEVTSVRIEAISGKRTVGIEIPNDVRRTVGLRELCSRQAFWDKPGALVTAIGEDISGKPVYADLAPMPHVLIAGATNSGKSIGVASMLTSFLVRYSPTTLRMVLIDPKRVELSLFDDIPHLMCPVVTDVKEVPGVLRAIVREMERRYDVVKQAGQRNIVDYNRNAAENDRFCYLAVVVDELADLIMQCQEVEGLIVRLAQKARAVGIHLILATQRPSADIVTGLIKANVPSRIAFAVASGVDSRVILDTGGAEALVGRGDMLFSPLGAPKPQRVQGAFVSTEEVDRVCRFWKDQGKPAYEMITFDSSGEEDTLTRDEETLYGQALDFARSKGLVSTSMIQRQYSVGFQTASRIIDELEKNGVIGPRDGPRPRKYIGEADSE
jgi:DNA segregation ATPase FtsK/SpoIIIE, S-DNA-T family